MRLPIRKSGRGYHQKLLSNLETVIRMARTGSAIRRRPELMAGGQSVEDYLAQVDQEEDALRELCSAFRFRYPPPNEDDPRARAD